MAILAAPSAQAAPPNAYYTSFSPINPRTTTPIGFIAGGEDPDATKVQYAWDFSAGGTFSALADESALEHTFSSDGVHWVVSRLQDAAGEQTDTRFPVATHPDNWAPIASFDDYEHSHFRTESPEDQDPLGQRLRVYLDHDDSPKAGHAAEWDLNGDGAFNGTGDGNAIPDQPLGRRAYFTTDGNHPIKVKVLDGQGEQTVVSGNVRTHTLNEGPFLQYQESAEVTFTKADLAEGAYLGGYWADDYSSYSDITYGWKLDDVVQEGQSGSGFQLPSDLAVGDHTLVMTASDDGRLATDTIDPTGDRKSTSHTFKVKVIESYPVHAAELSAYSYIDWSHSATASFRTLENIRLYAYEGAGKHATSYQWDLDNDGQFDDSTGYGTYFSAANKGTYRVAVRMEIKDGTPITLDRSIVIDKGTDYAPAPPANNTNTNTGNQNPPVATPEQVKAAMVTFLSKETAEFLQLVSGQNKKGIDAAKAILVLGTLDAEELPNGGTGVFKVYDKAGKKLVARAAAAKRKLLGSTKVTLAKGQSKKVQVKLNKKGKALLKKKGKVKLTVDATLTDALTGAQVTQSKTYTFKVKKKKRRK